MIETDGFREMMIRFSSLPTDVGVEVRKAVNQGALMVHADAVRSIRKPSGGRVYVRRSARRGKRGFGRGSRTGIYIASKPGDVPNTDTGNLIKNIRVSRVKGNTRKGYSVYVRAVTPYARRLELGGRDKRGIMIKARPFMGPALAKNAPKIEKLIFNAVRSQL